MKDALNMVSRAFNFNYDAMKQALSPHKFGPWSELKISRSHATVLFTHGGYGRYHPATHSISIYDEATGLLKAGRPNLFVWAIVHEIGHVFDYAGSRDVGIFLHAIGAPFFSLGYNAPPGALDNYAKVSPAEDFAQTFAWYVFDVNDRYVGSPISAFFGGVPSESRRIIMNILITGYTQ